MELFKANKQWSTRPEDEKFSSLESLRHATKHYAEQAQERRVAFSDLRVEAQDGEVQMVGRANIPARFTNWAFGQLCQRVGAPASYLRDLPATLACQNLNHGLAARVLDASANKIANLMFHANGGLVLRSILTDDYSRIWNHEVCDRLLTLQSSGWKPAAVDIRAKSEAGTADDLDLYASDHDMFAFLHNSNLSIEEQGSDGAIYKGVIVENSEVGASALKITRFLYREKCGNHIIWGASKVLELSVRHVGDARYRWNGYFSAVRRYAEESVSDLEAKIAYSRVKLIGSNKEEVLDAIFGKKSIGLSRTTLEKGYDSVDRQEDGDPNTVWGFVQGLTRFSQTVPYADKRTDIDRAAGRILDVAF